jgi:hypothetical protein
VQARELPLDAAQKHFGLDARAEEFAVKPERLNAMSSAGASANHNHWVKAIESKN